MKYILSAIMLFTFHSCIAQSPYKYLIEENKNVRFEAVYEVEGSKEQVKSLVISELSKVKGVSDVKENLDGFSASVDGYEIDFRKLGYSSISAPFFIQKPITANMSVQVKEGRYRVVLTNIIAGKTERGKGNMFDNTDIETMVLKLNKSGWATAKKSVKIGTETENDFYESFKIKETESDW